MTEHNVGYLVIADHYRRLIADRQIPDGGRLPSVRKIAEEWHTSTKTAQRALKALCMEGYATAVTGLGYAARFRADEVATLRVPVVGVRQRGEIYAPGDEIVIVSAEMHPAGGSIADMLGIEAGQLAVRRTGLVRRGDQVIRMSYSWFPAELADVVPELLSTEHAPPGSVARIEAATGRRTAITADHMTVDLATVQQAETFGIGQNEPLLVRITVRHDGEGVIEVGSAWWPRHIVLALEYTDPTVGTT